MASTPDSPQDQPLPPEPTPTTESKGLPKRLRGTSVAQDEVAPAAVGRLQPARQDRALELARRCAQLIEENRGKDVVLLDMRGATSLVDYFVIATAGSRRQANATASDIDAAMKRLGEYKLGMEGSEEGRWILLDYGDFVVHVFGEEARPYYGLDDIWGDAPRLEWADPDRPVPPSRRAAQAPLAAPDDDADADDLDDDATDDRA